MQHLHKVAAFLLALLGLAAAHAQSVPFVSGEEYQIRCLELPGAAVAPRADDPRAIVCTAASAADTWWRVTRQGDGQFLLVNTASGRFLTYDGVRTSIRRYAYLSTTDHGDRSRWNIYAATTALGVKNHSRGDQYLNVRRNIYVVGTYGETAASLTSNERFFLVNRKGKVVDEFYGKKVVLPATCYSNVKKALAAAPSMTSFIDNSTYFIGATVSRNGSSNTSRGTAVGLLSFTINKKSPVYTAGTDKYLFSVPERKLSGSVEVHLAAASSSGGRLYVDGQPVPRNGKFTFTRAGRARYFRISQTNAAGDTVATARLQFTALPIVEIKTSGLSKHSFTDGTFCLHAPDASGADSTLRARFRHRGDYTSLLSKKSYGVKLVDAKGQKLDRSLLGMRSDNYWVLDALAVDPARMRNRVAMDLWGDMATPPYYAASARGARTAVSGRLVEVFENGSYRGVYNLSERIDRKQLQLAHSKKGKVRGCLYKSNNWDTWTLLGAHRSSGKPVGQRPPHYDNNASRWGYWESKYPEPGNGQKTDWKPLYEGCALAGAADDKEFCRQVAEVFDLPALADYYLFIELIHAVDNSGKNMYWAVYDASQSRKLTPVPWDLDGTFGRNWGGHRSDCRADNDYRRYLINGSMQNALFERLYKLNAAGWNDLLASRYRKLRRTHFSPDALYGRFAAYHHLMQESGAERREWRKWSGNGGTSFDFDAENAYLKNWIKARVEYLDRQYGYR